MFKDDPEGETHYQGDGCKSEHGKSPESESSWKEQFRSRWLGKAEQEGSVLRFYGGLDPVDVLEIERFIENLLLSREAELRKEMIIFMKEHAKPFYFNQTSPIETLAIRLDDIVKALLTMIIKKKEEKKELCRECHNPDCQKPDTEKDPKPALIDLGAVMYCDDDCLTPKEHKIIEKIGKAINWLLNREK